MALDRIITEYILSPDARRIIIPGIGAFIKRGGGELVFMDILSADDGVLTGEVSRQEEIPADKAADKVAKYAASLKAELDKGRAVNIEGLGAISPKGGKTVFVPSTQPQPKPYAKEQKPEPNKTEQPFDRPATKPYKILATEQHATSVTEQLPDSLATKPYEILATEQHATPVTEQQATSSNAQPHTDDVFVPRIRIRQQTKKRKRTDVVMIIAILALLAAVAAIAYGMLVENQIPIIN